MVTFFELRTILDTGYKRYLDKIDNDDTTIPFAKDLGYEQIL